MIVVGFINVSDIVKNKPLDYKTIKAVENRYGFPMQTYIKVNDKNVWKGNNRNLVWDGKVKKLYCETNEWASHYKGGWFYGCDPNDPKLEYS